MSHTLIVWMIALGGLYLGQSWDSEAIEPYFQVASVVIMLGIALWMIWRTWSYQRGEHGHGLDETKYIETEHWKVRLEFFEQGQPPRFRLYRESIQFWEAETAGRDQS